MALPSSLWDEVVAAGRGVVALIVGDKAAPRYFQLTPRGLVGSFIGVVIIATVGVYLPIVLGVPEAQGTALVSIVFIALLTAINAGISALALRQLRRLDGFVPFLVADNWSSVFVTLASLVLRIAGFDATLLLVATFMLSLLIAVNIARLVVALAPREVGLFVAAQILSFCLGQVLEGLMFQDPASNPPA